MESFSTVALMMLGIIVFLRVRDGSAGDWLRAKFFNSAAPAPVNIGRGTTGAGRSAGSGAADVVGGVIGDASDVLGTTGWAPPADGPIVSGFGPRKSPGGIGSTNHKGIDIDGRTGDPIRATRDGRVTYAGNSGGFGLRVDVDHGRNYVSRYAHLNRLSVAAGDRVRQGQKLGEMGATGTATGDHLHFEILRRGVQVDPAPYLPVGAPG